MFIRNGLNFFELFNFYFSLEIDHNPPCSLYSHDSYFLSYVSFTRSLDQEKSISYYDLFNFGVLPIYGRIPTLIFFYLLHNPTTPILPIYVDQRRPYLEKDTTQTRGMVIQEISTVPRRTLVAPD